MPVKRAISQCSESSSPTQIPQVTDGMLIALPPEFRQESTGLAVNEFNQIQCQVADSIDLEVYRKSTHGPKKLRLEKKHDRKVVHVPAARILAHR